MTDIQRKALKLLQALDEDCGQNWATCRHCLAHEELLTKEGRMLVGVLLDWIEDLERVGEKRLAKRRRYLDKRGAAPAAPDGRPK